MGVGLMVLIYALLVELVAAGFNSEPYRIPP